MFGNSLEYRRCSVFVVGGVLILWRGVGNGPVNISCPNLVSG